MEIVLKYFDDFTETQMQQMQLLEALYKDWNEKINVISRKDIDALYEKHVLHSLAVTVVCNFHNGARVLDVGTGGGFPGIPLAIFFPNVHFTLADSIGKKIRVVQEIATSIGLKNVTAVHARAEDLKVPAFDFAVSRAVAPLGEVWGWVHGMIRKGQCTDELPNGLICLKGGDLEKEIEDSGLKARVQAWSVNDIFPEPFFDEKYLIYVAK